MKVIITDVHTPVDEDVVMADIAGLIPEPMSVSEVIVPTSTGVDAIAMKWARWKGIPIKEFQIDRGQKRQMGGSMATLLKNKRMAVYCDYAIVIWDGAGDVAANLISWMVALDKPVYVKVV